ncbi:hypothetical protein N7457_009583 [Penicillium paradoxum]|uniref:uncharacterized protein n=1 Tax=Penicillium paradoxum TaxID=176176 RepID=UPI0025478810|nr:uncharacterized protein N7457_009583 [Penicillium paradoxum]KAJ5774687.1 hypothetical protein N7457_009583 [Penicillium paradoxum]
MARHSRFQSGRKPQGHPGFPLKEVHVTGPFSFLNPTSAHYALIRDPTRDPNTEPSKEYHVIPQVERLWRSRDNRKGRHAVQVDTKVSPHETGIMPPESTRSVSAVAKGLLRMATYAPYWDVSYLVATSFTFGSAIWILNAFFAWLPHAAPKTKFHNESLIAGGVTGLLGGLVFEIGSVLLLLEAINTNNTGCFGWALEAVVSRPSEDGVHQRGMTELKPSVSECEHHHANRRSFLRMKHPRGDTRAESRLDEHGYVTYSPDGRSFRWIPSMKEVRTHYIHELGFLASLIEFVSATIFWVATISGAPGIFNHMSQGLTDGIYWIPQIVGGTGFILSGLLFTLETQTKWYIPAWHVLGWHVGVWNLIGGIGFTLCGALGPASNDSRFAYQSTLATFWGSVAFMIGSMIQWYESLQKYPVEKK